MVCKGLCDSQILKSQMEIKSAGGRASFKPGYKLCTTCERMFEYEGNHCPCCGYKLRITPRGNKNGQRDKYLEKINIKRL